MFSPRVGLVKRVKPVVEVGMQCGDAVVDFPAKGDAIERVEPRLVRPLDDAVGPGDRTRVRVGLMFFAGGRHSYAWCSG
ncbi:hypothetical protein MB84_28970 (plasmid) [Pandoraea oxalativorans]|uniref:Uncharacterized protein n=2 Tax=Pandoraea oxalativorans TaxID=573737 RepID=A0A0G3IG55_9BURK|nr:hypothetical protein MB84_28970 [Pandoraea oxalativorans]